MYKIAIIIPYFGKFPEWIDLFLYSCSLNKKIADNIAIDWFIFTDCELPRKIYNNTIFIQMSFKEYCQHVMSCLHIDFSPKTAYKFCDLKPFYGLVHESMLSNYTHWGFGDLDLCYGDLSLIINEKRLRKYELITTHADRIAGHFTIIKKDSIYSKLCLKIVDWQNKLNDEKVLGLDEMDLTHLVRRGMVDYLRLYRYLGKPFHVGIYDFMQFPNIVHNWYSKTFIKEFYTSPLPKTGEQWVWDVKNNHILNPWGKEIPYLHFLFFKKTPFWDTPNYWKSGFYCLPQDISIIKNGMVIFDNKSISYKNKE